MGAYTSGADVAPYISNRADFQRLQDTITAAFTPKEKSEPTSEDKKNQAEEAYWKSLTKTTPSTINSFKNKPSFGLNYEIPKKIKL